jgi:hypothetical protein
VLSRFATGLGGTGAESAKSVVVDSSASLWVRASQGSGLADPDGHFHGIGGRYLAGEFSSSSLTVGGFELTNSGGSDVFVAKMGHQGDVHWAKAFAGSGTDQAALHALAVGAYRHYPLKSFFFFFLGMRLRRAGDRLMPCPAPWRGVAWCGVAWRGVAWRR